MSSKKKRPFKNWSNEKIKEEYEMYSYMIYDLVIFGTRDVIKLMCLESEILIRGGKIRKEITI